METNSNEPRIVFSHDGAYIKLSNGLGNKRPFIYKEQVIQALLDYHKEEKISKKEMWFFISEIVTTTYLHWENKGTTKIIDGITFISVPKKIINPYFEICKCAMDTTYGHLKNGDGTKITGAIYSKDRGQDYIDFFLETGKIDDDTYMDLSRELKSSRLPEHSLDYSMN